MALLLNFTTTVHTYYVVHPHNFEGIDETYRSYDALANCVIEMELLRLSQNRCNQKLSFKKSLQSFLNDLFGKGTQMTFLRMRTPANSLLLRIFLAANLAIKNYCKCGGILYSEIGL